MNEAKEYIGPVVIALIILGVLTAVLCSSCSSTNTNGVETTTIIMGTKVLVTEPTSGVFTPEFFGGYGEIKVRIIPGMKEIDKPYINRSVTHEIFSGHPIHEDILIIIPKDCTPAQLTAILAGTMAPGTTPPTPAVPMTPTVTVPAANSTSK